MSFLVRLTERLGMRRHPPALAFDVWAQRAAAEVATASSEAPGSPAAAQEMPVLRAIAGYVA